MPAPTERRELRAEDFDAKALELLADYLAQRLQYLDRINRRQMDGYATAAIRGAIAEVQHMAQLVEPKLLPTRAGSVGDKVSVADDLFMERYLRSAGPSQL